MEHTPRQDRRDKEVDNRLREFYADLDGLTPQTAPPAQPPTESLTEETPSDHPDNE